MNEIKNMFNLEKKEDGTVAVSGRELHKGLGIETQYTKWIERMIAYGFEENTDYIVTSEKIHSKKRTRTYEQTNHIITLDMAKVICAKQETEKTSGRISEFLYSIDEKTVSIFKPNRKEIEFGKMLKSLTNIEWEEQYPIDGGKYFLDFYSTLLIVEYDESYHKYQEDEDFSRIKYCQEWLAEKGLNEEGNYHAPAVIRVKEGKELEGIKNVITHLVNADFYTKNPTGDDVDLYADVLQENI